MWQNISLNEVADIVMGQSPPSSTYNELGDGKPFFQGAKDFDYFHPKPRVYCTKPTRMAQTGDILFSLRAPIGRVSIADRECAIGRGLAAIRTHDRADSRFLEYTLRSKENYWETLDKSGTVFGNITKQELESLKIPWPFRKIKRQSISHKLGAFDDKIYLNYKTNENLEKIIIALFKSWFVNFDYVHENKKSQVSNLPYNYSNLFPDRLVKSTIGEIPEGWKVSTIGDELSEIVSGARPKGGSIASGVPSIGAENIIKLGQYNYNKEKYIPVEYFDKLRVKGADVKNGDVLLYKDGANIGRKTYVDCDFPHSVCAINEHVFILRLKQTFAQRFLYFWLEQNWITQSLIALNSNSAQPGVNQNGIRGLPLLMPPDDVLIHFDEIVSSLTSSIFNNMHNCRTLATMRDTLISRLLSNKYN